MSMRLTLACHGRRKPAPSEGRGPAIHVFPCRDPQSRGWRAPGPFAGACFARHDAEGKAGWSSLPAAE
jgi:hypothetical protein